MTNSKNYNFWSVLMAEEESEVRDASTLCMAVTTNLKLMTSQIFFFYLRKWLRKAEVEVGALENICPAKSQVSVISII